MTCDGRRSRFNVAVLVWEPLKVIFGGRRSRHNALGLVSELLKMTCDGRRYRFNVTVLVWALLKVTVTKGGLDIMY